MSRRLHRGWRRRRLAWGFGLCLLALLAFAVHAMFEHTLRRAPAPGASPPGASAADAEPSVPGLVLDAPAGSDEQPAVRGVVLRPDGRPAVGATVSFYRAQTAWPELRRLRVGQAITREDGVFQFRSADRHGLLVGYEHPELAGGLEEVPLRDEPMELRLEVGFELYGYVFDDAGVPVANARVAIESVPGDFRRAEVATTTASGRYAFAPVRAGPVRLVARHDAWQPVVAPAVVIGDQSRVDLRFDRPTTPPLRGRVIGASSQQPVAGARVELVPLRQKLGLVVPVVMTTGGDGLFTLAGLPRGSMRLVVRHPEFGAVLRTVTLGGAVGDLVVELPPRSVVEGVFAGHAVAGELLQVQDASGQVAFTRVEADGGFRFPQPLSPGVAELRLPSRRFAFDRSGLPSMSVRVEETAINQIDLVAVPPTVVRGRFVGESGGPLGGVAVVQTRVLVESAREIGDAAWQLDLAALGSQVAQLFGSERDETLAVSAADGSFEIRGAAPGSLLLRGTLRGYGSRWLRVVVPASGTALELGDQMLVRGGRIEGRVLRGSRTLAGATVVAIGADAQASTVSTQQGAFVLEDLLPGSYRVRARLPGQSLAGTEATVEVSAGAVTRGVLLSLDLGRTVRGVVVGSEGQAVGGALVGVRGAIGQTTVTDGSGEFVVELPERAVELTVSLGDRSRPHVVAVAADATSVQVRLDTPPTCTLLARFVGLPQRRPVAGGLLRLTPLDEVGAAPLTRWIELPNGELRWPMCPVGRVGIEFVAEGQAPFVIERATLANEEHQLGQVLLEPGAEVRGVVRDVVGAPVADAVVALGEELDLELFEPRVRSGADGAFVLRGVTCRSTRVVARAPGFATGVVELELPRDVLADEPVVLPLDRGATIEVQVARGRAADVGMVQLRRLGRLVAGVECDESGRAWFTNRSAGEYTLHLDDRDSAVRTVVVPRGADVVKVVVE
jgi:hypothetical protein